VEVSEKLGEDQKKAVADYNKLIAEGKVAEAQAYATLALYAAVNTFVRWAIINDKFDSFFSPFKT
jgi:hypothetical protein